MRVKGAHDEATSSHTTSSTALMRSRASESVAKPSPIGTLAVGGATRSSTAISMPVS
jgi:hypothetical protein